MNTEEIKKNIGMLRQWLNEDRIDDPKKFVTNEHLEEWLELDKFINSTREEVECHRYPDECSICVMQKQKQQKK